MLCRIDIVAFEAQASGPAPRGAARLGGPPHLFVAPLKKRRKKEKPVAKRHHKVSGSLALII